jgi:hypothetical protein
MTPLLFSTHPRIRALAALTAVLCLTGCDAIDPFKRPGLWRPAGINEMNFDTQVANSRDLRMGHGSTTVDGETAAAPVDRLRRDKMRPLPAASISSIGSSGGASGGGGN